MKSQLTITQVNTLENQRKKTAEVHLTNSGCKNSKKKKKKKKDQKKKRKRKKLDHHIADLTSKFYEKYNPCPLKMVIIILCRTINTKPK